ncbi:LytTR family DNA-binding domain-containing protein [Chryseobacterium sp. BIGb0232]|uniref:LytR/AlgR family response regulator transcription factor n=1 Tax=Chryseobacterium sp. BIGb0232 TaxID=2940598 RepID=UPI000F4ABA26|nr:LytTR family DNA-binding domain-containing protein [Chryseobacterium sp. BIGb0232]MCS4301076.1 hypothetical protein [Chryseobacterium sp. BIGb0232]ROS20061.1 LytTR family transcriptional regulator [Chryseobacterium nakagawai]
MIYPVPNNEIKRSLSPDVKTLFLVLSGIILTIVGLTIFQDFLESKRGGYHFYISESFLFKTVWFLYLPTVMVLYQKLKYETFTSLSKTIVLILAPIAAHLFILPCLATFFSILFYEGLYDWFKFFSYNLTHDLYLLMAVYTGVVLGYRYFGMSKNEISVPSEKLKSNSLVITNGKHNIIVNVEDILQITSATPYVSIHVNDKKYLHSETLKSIHSKLDAYQFIRVHKSVLVNLSKVRSFRSRLNGDYDLEMSNGSVVRLSRTYAADFKNLFHKGSSG